MLIRLLKSFLAPYLDLLILVLTISLVGTMAASLLTQSPDRRSIARCGASSYGCNGWTDGCWENDAGQSRHALL